MSQKILIIDDDLDTLRLVGLMLQRQGYQISAATDGPQGLAKAFDEKPNLILLDIMMPDMDGYEVARRLRANPKTAKTPILMFTAKTQLDDRVSGFEAGADDYLTKPTHPSELQSHVKSLLARNVQPAVEGKTASHEHHGEVVAVLSARGGLGVTTVSANLAAGIVQNTLSDVVLAELIPGQGSLGLELGETNQNGLVNLLKLPPAEISRDRVAENLVRHHSGLKLLLSSDTPKDYPLINQVEQYENLVARLSTLGRYVILDVGMGLPPFVQRLLRLVSEVIVVLEGVPNTITHTRALIDNLIELGINMDRLTVVLNNRIRTDTQMITSEVQRQLGHPVAVTLTPAPEMFEQASRMKTPALLCQPESLTSKQLNKLAELVTDREA